MAAINTPQNQLLPLPADPNPANTVCITMQIPDDPTHLDAFLGVLYDLSHWYSWDRDDAKTGKDAALAWRKALSTLKFCSTPKSLTGMELEEKMPFRIDCNCNVFVECCDGTEKQLLTGDQVKALINGGASNGAPQPPMGGCQTYHISLPANQQAVLPTVVNSGDVLTFSNGDGAATDRTGPGPWYCPNGSLYIAGSCIGLGGEDPGDPMTTVPHMQVIVNINGTYYDIATPLTVPSGIVSQQCFFQVNDGNISDNSGGYVFDIQRCNNETPPPTPSVNLTNQTDPFACGGHVTFDHSTVHAGDVFTASCLTASGDGRFGLCWFSSANATFQVLAITGWGIDGSTAYGWNGSVPVAGVPAIGTISPSCNGWTANSPTAYTVTFKVLSIP